MVVLLVLKNIIMIFVLLQYKHTKSKKKYKNNDLHKKITFLLWKSYFSAKKKNSTFESTTD